MPEWDLALLDRHHLDTGAYAAFIELTCRYSRGLISRIHACLYFEEAGACTWDQVRNCNMGVYYGDVYVEYLP